MLPLFSLPTIASRLEKENCSISRSRTLLSVLGSLSTAGLLELSVSYFRQCFLSHFLPVFLMQDIKYMCNMSVRWNCLTLGILGERDVLKVLFRTRSKKTSKIRNVCKEIVFWITGLLQCVLMTTRGPPFYFYFFSSFHVTTCNLYQSAHCKWIMLIWSGTAGVICMWRFWDVL